MIFFQKEKHISVGGCAPPHVKKSGGDLHWLTAPGPGSGGTFLKLNVKKNSCFKFAICIIQFVGEQIALNTLRI